MSGATLSSSRIRLGLPGTSAVTLRPRGSAAVAALGAAVVALAFAGLPWDRAVVAAVTAVALLVVSAVDIERGLIPNRVVLPATAIVISAQIALFPDRAGEWLLACVLAAMFFLLPHLVSRRAVGMGDVKLAALLGAALGWEAFAAILIGFVVVFPVAVAMLVRGGSEARKTAIPFGPFLALGALIVLFGPVITGS